MIGPRSHPPKERLLSQSLAAPLQGPVSLSLPFSAESAGEVRRSLTSWLSHHGTAASVIEDARLVVTELVANAIRHADPLRNSMVLVRWRLEQDLLVLDVCDGGSDSVPEVVEVPFDSESGRGMAIVEALTLQWKTVRHPNLHAVQIHMALR